MKEIILTMKENTIYKQIKMIVDNGDENKTSVKNRAAIKLRCTTRNINLLIKKYKALGKSGFSHGNKQRTPKHTLDDFTKKKILKLYNDKYFDFNWNHLREKLNEDENIIISYTALTNLLKTNGYISHLAFKRTKRAKKKELENKNKLTPVDKIIIQDMNILDSEDSHPRKPRSKYFGEQIQMDASSMIWFEDVFAHLHLAVDDCTGHVVGAYFDTQETLNGYYNTFYQILNNHGIPNQFFTDRRTVFEYKQIKNPKPEQDTYTQFGYACQTLGVEIITSSVAQAKGRIERFNGSFKRRLPQELRIAKIKTIEEANKFLSSYIPKFNKRFSLLNNHTKSVFESKPSSSIINTTLAVIASRKFDNGSSVKFNNNYYQAFKGSSSMPTCFYKGTEGLIIKAFDGQTYLSVNEHIYQAKILPSHMETSKTFDIEDEPKNKPRVYIPPMSHPWKHASYMNYLNSQKHLSNNAHV